MRFRFIEENRDALPAGRLCQIMNVSSRGFRAYRSRPISQSQRKDMVLLAHIREQHKLSLGSYGRPRMTEELKELGLEVGHRRVGRLMRQNGISVVRTRKHKVTTDSNHKFNIASNLLNRDFFAEKPNQKWAGDISYIWTREGWLYLAVILDLHSRRVIGWAVSNRMKRDLAIRALDMAVALREPPSGCIHHSDRGSQYCSHDYQKRLRQHGLKVSMSGKGNCYEFKQVRASGSKDPGDHLKAQNAVVETFFKTIKAELIWRQSWKTRRQAEMAIFGYINGFYNPRRKHSALGWKNPLAFERKVA
jgi:transposase InsO family protein